MGGNVPLLNDYKKEFFWKRFPQTILGGPKLHKGEDIPAYIYINQIILFLLPWVLGAVFTCLVHFEVMKYDIGVYIYGTVIFLFVLIVNILGAVIKSKQALPVSDKFDAKNVLSEDDDIHFESCCGAETISYVIPGKKFKVNIVIHAVLSGVLCGLTFWYLLPQVLDVLYGSSAATVVLHILSWFTLCIAQYSLTVGAPPELATFRTLDTWEFAPLMRPFYVMLFVSFHLLEVGVGSDFQNINFYLHILFIFLPLMWTAGFLPPLDAFFLWIFEQALVILFGGSPMASDIRLLVMLIVSVVSYVIAYFIPKDLVIVVIYMACFGYLLSTDLGGLGSQILNKCSRNTDMRSGYIEQQKLFLWRWHLKEIIFHFVMVLVVGGVSAVVHEFAPTSLSSSLAYVSLGLLVIQAVLSEIQQVYVFFGLWRNKLYPGSAQRTHIYQKRKKILNVFGHIKRVIMDIVAPFVMLAFLSTKISHASTTTATSDVFIILGTNRAFRWIWQSTQNSLLEISILQICELVLASDSFLLQLQTGLQLLLISFCRNRSSILLDKLYFYFTLLIKSWSDKKQRHAGGLCIIATNIFLFPLAFGVILLSTFLAAPLLPLFTLPLFMIGFPRPLRSWPNAVGASANVNADTVYYRQLTPQLSTALRQGFASGSIGDPSPGKQLMVRFQDRLMWVIVLERGYTYCSVNIKGLELQETSCHTVEATRLDDIFEIAFEKEGGFSCCTWNKYPMSALKPCDAALIKTYSDAKNVLTGVIDSPDALKMMDEGFIKTLIWVLLKHIAQVSVKTQAKARPPSAKPRILSGKNKVGHADIPPEGNLSKNANVSGFFSNESWLDETKEPTKTPRDNSKRPLSAASRMRRSASLGSLVDSMWSDNDSLLMESINEKPKTKLNLVSGYHSRHLQTNPSHEEPMSLTPVEEPMVLTPVTNFKSPKQNMDKGDSFEDLDFGLPALDLKQESQNKKVDNKPPGGKPGNAFTVAQSDSAHSSFLTIPVGWQEIPIDGGKLNSLLGRFPTDWYTHVLSTLDVKNKEALESICQDKGLEKMYSQLVMASYGIVNVLGLGGGDVISHGTSHVYKVYTGEIPWSVASDWLTEDKELLRVVLQAYRYSVKLAIDQVLLGEASSPEELQEYMEEYDKDWYIGSEKDPAWKEAIVKSKPTLFSLDHDLVGGTYNSRVLTNQDMMVYIGSINEEAVRGQWANLSLELLYMTNDDEERYSIQAHSTLLRNLTVQAAEPPLGYPIFSSEPISIPTF